MYNYDPLTPFKISSSHDLETAGQPATASVHTGDVQGLIPDALTRLKIMQ